MSNFGIKSFLRAIALFISILLVKLGIDKIIQIPETSTKILYAIIIIVVVLILLFVPGYMPPIKRKNPNQDGKNDQ